MQQRDALARQEAETSLLTEPSQSALVGANSQRVPEHVVTILAAIWKELLRIPHINEGDDFFDLGGDSLGAIRMLERIGNAFGEDLLEPDIIYTAGSFGELAQAIALALNEQAKT